MDLLLVSYLNAAQMSNVTVVLLYAALLVIVTSMISLRTNDPDPMLAGRNMPWWLVAGSIIGTSVSSIAFLAIPTKGYVMDLYFLIGDFFGAIGGIIFGVVFFVAFLRNTRDASIYTLLADRFGRWSATYASIAFILYSILRMGVITCLVAQAIHLICGADIVSVMVLTGFIVIFYTYMSGIEGVIWTDFFQTLILLTAGAASIYFLMDSIPEKGSDLFSLIQTGPKLLDKTADIQSNWPLLAISFLFFFFVDAEFYSSNQGLAQRYIVARSLNHARWGAIIGGAIIPMVAVLFFAIGVLLYVFYNGTNLLEMPLEGQGVETVFAHFIAHHFPNGLKGLAIVGILAAAMSTIDTGINSSSTVLICNLYEPHAKASAQKQSLLTMQILRASSVAFGIAGICAAYFIYLNGESALKVFWSGKGVITSGVFGLFLLMRANKKAGPKAAIGALFCGTAIALWMTFTTGKEYAWASPFHYMLTLPISSVSTLLIGLGLSALFKEESSLTKELRMPSAKARKQLAQKRKRTKKNIFADSLRPKPFYRLYAGIATIAAVVIYMEGSRLGLQALDYWFVWMAGALLSIVAALPFLIKDTYNKRYILVCLTLIGLALPFVGAIGMFAPPTQLAFSYFYWVTLVAMGTMMGWTMLGLVSMITTAAAAQVAVQIYPIAGIPDNWATIAIGALGIFTYFAMDAAKENMITERALGRIHTIVEKIYAKVVDVSIDLARAKRALNFQDMDRLAKAAGDVKLMLSALLGATDINPEETHMELSVRETVEHILARFSKKSQASVKFEGDEDFNILGNRDIFESIVGHIFDNALYYVENGQATTVICTLDKHKKTFTLANDGPTIGPKHMPYIFDLGYTCDKESLGLGLAYCKKMLEGMRSGIRLISKPNEPWVQFRLYFPKYAELPEEARMFNIKDTF